MLLLLVVVSILMWKNRSSRAVLPTYVQHAPVAFNFHYPKTMTKTTPSSGEFARYELRDGADVVDSFAVKPIRFSSYRGEITGQLPLVAEREIARLKRDLGQFELVEEGRTRIKAGMGYGLVFQGKKGKQHVEGKLVILPELTSHPRSGVVLSAASRVDKRNERAQEIGSDSASGIALRSFELGSG